MKRFYDFIIIGSGAAGGVLSYYLTKSGADVLMLEAGKHYTPDTFPDNELDANAQLMWNGGTDMSTDASTIFLRGKAVGGGTIVNQCLLDRFDDVAYDDWRTVSDIDFLNSKTMERHYDEVESHIDLYHLQKKDWNRNAEIYTEGFDKLGLEWAPLRRGQNKCDGNDCIVCLGGCPRSSKQSTFETFIPKALKQGLTLISEFEAGEVIHGNSFVTVHGKKNGKSQSFYGAKCVVACGAIGSTQLLLNSGLQNRLPALGDNFFCHPQWMSIGFFNEIVDSHKGSFQSVKSSDPRFRQWGFKLENVFAGPVAVAMLRPGYGFEHQNFMKRYRNMACIEVSVRDQDPGSIRLNNKGRLVIKKPLSEGDRQRANRGNELIRNLFEAQGAYEVMTSPLQIGLHLMGGCNIGQNEATSVVNEAFQVHGLPNLYVADSGIFPNAPGINPSLSIMALAHRASESMLAEFGENIETNKKLNIKELSQ